MDGNDISTAGKCPVMHGANTETGTGVMDWWPNALNLDILHQHDSKTNPLPGYDYRAEVQSLDVAAASMEPTQAPCSGLVSMPATVRMKRQVGGETQPPAHSYQEPHSE